MEIEISEESKSLILKSFSVLLSAQKEELVSIQKTLSIIERFQLENGMYVLKRIVENMCKINKKLDIALEFSKQNLIDAFNASVVQLMKRKEIQISSLTDERLNLEVPHQFEVAQDLLLTDTLMAYDQMCQVKIPITELVPTVAALVTSLTTDASEYFIRQQAICLHESVKIGRKYYQGHSGLISIAQIMISVLNELKSEDIQLDTITNKDDEDKVKGNTSYEPICNFLLEPLDKMGGITTNMIYYLEAYQEVGKTKFLSYINDIATAQGAKVAMYQEESPPKKIIGSIKSHAFYRKYGKQVSWQEMDNPSLIKDSDELKMEVSIFSNAYYQTEGTITLLNDLTLSNFEDRILDHYYKGVTLFLLDGISTMSPGSVFIPNYGTVQGKKTLIDMLLLKMKDLKIKYPISFFIANWSNTEELNTKKNNSTGSAAYQQFADASLEMVKVQGLADTLRAMKITKWREESGSGKMFLTDTMLKCCHFEYSEDIQHLLNTDKIKEKI